MSALKIENVDYKYEKDLVLKNVSFEIKNNSFFVLLGLNGAGKSTIFALLTRLLNLQEGSIIINGHNIKNYQKALKSLGIVFQEPTLDLDLTVKQNLYFYGSMQGLSFKDTMNSIESEIDKLELREKLDVIVRDLNGGHRRRVEILRALINTPKLLLLDEATVGLDVKSRFEILEYIKRLVKEKSISVLWITHLFDEVEPTDDIAIIKDGKIIEDGVMNEIMTKYEKDSLPELFKYLTK